MKKIVIHAQEGVRDDLITAAQDAADELLSMFPEYKNSFKVEIRKDENIGDVHKTLKHIVEEASKNAKSGTVNASDIANAQTEKNNNDIVVSLVNETFDAKKKNGVLYGLAAGNGVSISTISCNEPEFLKTIFIHEMGHVFNATHKDRANTVFDENKGTHCKGDLCIMGDDNYPELNQERLRRKNEKSILYPNGRPPFCDDCIASMREYLSHMPGLVREVNVQPREETRTTPVINHPEILRETLPVLPHNDRSWKKDLRTFYKQVANDNDYEYKEELLSENYLARMKRKDGSVLNIEANNEYNIALGAKKANGDDDIPSVEDMRDLVNYAKSKKSSMNFGKENEPEFNARLMIACLEAEPPLKMRHAPKVNEAFLSKLDEETKKRLQKLLNPEEEQKQSSPTKTLTIGERDL